jgi:hypothetical protein
MFKYFWIGPLLIAIIFGLGCEGNHDISDSGPSNGAAADVDTDMDSNRYDNRELGGLCESSVRVGGLEVEHRADLSITAVTGSVAVGVVPSSVKALVEQRGDCRLLRRNDLFCDPGCQNDQTCAEENRCIPYPKNINVGVITVTGLSEKLELEPTKTGFHYSDGSIPYPGFESGDAIVLRADGGDYRPFTLIGFGVADFEFLDDAIVLDRNTPLELHWVAKNDPAARVFFTININEHGRSPLSLECELEDSGQATINAELVNALLDAGASGIPDAHLGRQTADSIAVDLGCIDFIVMSRVSLVVDVAVK